MFARSRPLPTFSVRRFFFHAFLWMLAFLGAGTLLLFLGLSALGLI